MTRYLDIYTEAEDRLLREGGVADRGLGLRPQAQVLEDIYIYIYIYYI